MKNKLTLIILGGLLFLFPYILIERSCDARIDTDIAELQGSYDAHKEKTKAEEEAWQKERKALNTQIKKWMNEAVEWEGHAKEYAGEAKAKDVIVADLREEYKILETETEKIVNLLAQNMALAEQYDGMKKAYESRGQEILRYKSVIDTKDIIIMRMEKSLDRKDSLLKLSEELVGKQRKRINSLKTGRTLSQVLAIGGWSVALYKTLVE